MTDEAEYDEETVTRTELNVTDENKELIMTSNFFYGGVFLVYCLLQYLFFNIGGSWLKKAMLTSYTDVTDLAKNFVGRLSCSLCLWFLIHCIITAFNHSLNDGFRIGFHTKRLWLHAVGLLIITIILLLVPDTVPDTYVEISIYVGALFLVLQLVFLISFLFLMKDKLKCCGGYLLVSISSLITLSSMAAISAGYYFFVVDSCSLQILILTINLGSTVLLTILSVCIQSSVHFVTSVVVAYVAYVTYMSLMIPQDCNRIGSSSTSISLNVVSSVFLLLSSSFTLSSDTSNNLCKGIIDRMRQYIFRASRKRTFSLAVFHFRFMLACSYICSVVTGWGYSSDKWITNKTKRYFWVNISMSWVCLFLYAWNLALHINHNREPVDNYNIQ